MAWNGERIKGDSPEVPASNIPVASKPAGAIKSLKFPGTIEVAKVEASHLVEVLDPHLQLDVVPHIDAGVLLLVRRKPPLERSCDAAVPFAGPLGVVVCVVEVYSVASAVAACCCGDAADAAEEGEGGCELH